MEGSGSVLIEVLSQHLSGGTHKKMKKLSKRKYTQDVFSIRLPASNVTYPGS
jgi:hypothetical protein